MGPLMGAKISWCTLPLRYADMSFSPTHDAPTIANPIPQVEELDIKLSRISIP